MALPDPPSAKLGSAYHRSFKFSPGFAIYTYWQPSRDATEHRPKVVVISPVEPVLFRGALLLALYSKWLHAFRQSGFHSAQEIMLGDVFIVFDWKSLSGGLVLNSYFAIKCAIHEHENQTASEFEVFPLGPILD